MRKIEDIYPLSPMQEVMLLHCVGNQNSTELTTQLVFELNSGANLSGVADAWQDVIKKHASLRTGFYWTGNKGPLQFVRPSCLLNTSELHITVDSDQEFEKRKSEIIAKDLNQPFDLSAPPLMRVTLLSSNTSKPYMIWTSHHLILDRWCTSIVLDDLSKFYTQREQQNQPMHLAKPAGKYRSHIEFIGGISDERTREYWQNYLAGFISPRPLISKQTAKSVKATESKTTTRDIRFRTDTLSTTARKYRATSAQLAQLAWSLTLAKIQRTNDVVYAITVSGRSSSISGVESIVGCFVNNVPTRTTVGQDSTLNSLVSSINDDQWSREDYQHESLATITEAMHHSQHGVALESLFVWLNAVELPVVEHGGLSFTAVNQSMASAFPVTVGFFEQHQSLSVSIKMNAGFESCESVDTILDVFEGVVNTIIETDPFAAVQNIPSLRLDELQTISKAEHGSENIQLARPTEVLSDRAGAREACDPVFLKQILVNEWKSVLNIDEIDESLSFFELGGTSIDAAKLHVRIEGMLRSSLPLLQIFQKPYINDMVTLIVEGEWAMHNSIAIPLKQHGKGRPLFFVASPDVNTIGCAQLVNKMKTERPVVLLQAPPDTSEPYAMSPSELPACAETYVGAMREIQNEGPYNLIGMCSGAQLSFEMAKVLNRENESCEFLGILNTWALFTVARRYRLQQFYTRFKLLKQEQLRDIPSVIWNRVVLRRLINPAVQHLHARIPAASVMKLAAGAKHSVDSQANSSDYSQVAKQTIHGTAPPEEVPVDEWVHKYGWNYKFRQREKINQNVYVMRTRSQPFWRIKSRDLGWHMHASSVEVQTLQCNDHQALLREPWVSEVAEILDSKMDSSSNNKQGEIQ